MKKRTTNKHLPERVYYKHGAYFYVDKESKWHRLGNTLSTAMQAWSQFIEAPEKAETMGQLFDRYMLEIAPQKAEASYRCNKLSIKHLYLVFGHMPPNAITPVHIYKYLDARGKVAPVRANREKSLLSHIFSFAIRWGVATDNPCRHVKRIPEKRRDRYVTNEEYQQILTFAPENIQNIMNFAYITGLRQSDVLKLKVVDLQDGGIFVHINKTKNKILIEWSDDLRTIVATAKAFSEQLRSEYLFPTQKGQAYTSSGFQTLWQRLMTRAVKENIIKERFRFHDIRRKTATEVEELNGRENARKLLGHHDQKTTGIYISGVQKVKPRS